jgi:hypothetical protein
MHDIGMDQPQSWSRKSVERMVPTILYMHSILWIWAGVEHLERETAARRAPWNQSTKISLWGISLNLQRIMLHEEIIKNN